MGFVDWIMRGMEPQRAAAAVELPEPAPWQTFDDWLESYTTTFDVTAKACIELKAELIAGLALRAVYRGTETPVPLDADNSGGAFNRLMSGYIDGFTPYEWKRGLFSSMFAEGEAVQLRRRRARGFVSDMIGIPVGDVRVERDKRTRELVYTVREVGTFTRDIVHIRLPNTDDVNSLRGKPPVDRNSLLLRACNMAMGRVYRNYQQSAGVQSVLLDDESGNAPDNWAKLHQLWRQRHSGIPFPVGQNVKVTEMGVPGMTADELLAHEFLRDNVARAHKVPLPMIGAHITEWGQGLAEMREQNRQTALLPAMSNVESALTCAVVNPAMFEVRFDDGGLMRGDWKARNDASKVLLGSHYNSLVWDNEIRGLYSLPPLPDGNVRQSVMAPMTERPDNDRENEDDDEGLSWL